MAERFHAHESLHSEGIAVGWSDIRNDRMHFKFRDETFTFPTIAVPLGVATFNGYFYTAEVETLRELAKNGRA